MISSDSLKKCYDVISLLDNSNPLWIPSYAEVKRLSFISNQYDLQQWVKEKNKSSAIFRLIETHEHFEEYVHQLKFSYNRIATDDDIVFCNEVLTEIFNDKYIDQALNNLSITIIRKIDPLRYVRFMSFNRLITNLKSTDSFAYWQDINDFTDLESQVFNGRPFKFHKRFINIIYGYVSGDIRKAYAEGLAVLDRYETLLTELCSLEQSSIFNYLPERRIGVTFGDEMSLAYLIKRIHDAKEGIISTRNDSFLTERAFVTELLKLFHEYGRGNPTAAVYRFTRSSLLENDIERKTIQRCWESLGVVDKD